MASTRQLKHHARFHAAVLRHLFPPPPPPPRPPPPALPPSYSPQEAPTDSKDQGSFQVHSPESAEVALEETHTDNNEEVEAGKVLLSRAQRKRLKLKKLKERQLNAIPAKRLIGPLLSGVLEKSMLVSDDENSNVEQNDISLRTRHKQGSIEIGKPEVFSTVSGEELVMPKKDYTSLCSETGEGKDIPAEVEPECLSKAKRRRLAKRSFHDSSRHSTVGSSFTAEIKGEDIIIKQIT